MKLKTEMVDFHGRMLPRSATPVQHFAFEHDAAAAHALMQAIDEIGTRGIQDADEITNRADEILAQWGFDTGEDA